MPKKFYITTPIYYANAAPHIGNSYTSLIGDVVARAKRMLGYEVKFATGTDENGQKMVQTATAVGKEVKVFLDEVAREHQRTWDELRISYTDFIRTTEPRHHKFVQEMLQKTFDAGDIYQGEYEGLYCVGCEAFKRSGDLIDHEGKQVCPDHLTPPQVLKEKNRFFKLASYQDRLQEFYKSNPDFCIPQFRFNEILSFVEQGLEDFSISREGSTFGIPIPFDPNAVTYIWFDALYNYLTVCQGGEEAYRNEGEVIHLIGKDIGRFHAVFWPAMLMASGWKLPDQIVINGYFTVDGQKMSKTLGNIIMPLDLIGEHGRDALVYYLFSDIKIGNDGDFSRERFMATKDQVLKKGWGNLVVRAVTLCKKYEVTSISIDADAKESHQALMSLADAQWLWDNWLWKAFIDGWNPVHIEGYLKTFDLVNYLRDRYQLVQLGNKRVDQTKPREVAKTDLAQAKKDLQVLVWLIKGSALLSAPFLLDGFTRFKELVNVQHPLREGFSTEKSLWEIDDLFDLKNFSVTYGEWYLY